jgi:probable O-glycosylation ligase (exosortase A-associated)
MAWGIARTFPVSMIVGVATIVGFFFWPGPKRWPRQRELYYLLGLWAAFAWSTGFAIFPDIAIERLVHVSKILIIPFLCTVLLNTHSRLHWLLRVIGLSLGGYGLKGGIFSIVSRGQNMVLGPEESFLFSNNAIGMALAMNVPLLFYLQRTEERAWLRWLVRAMLVFSYPAIVCTFSRGAWIAVGVVTLLEVMKSRHRFTLALVAGVVLFLLLPALPHLLPQRVVHRYDTLENYDADESAQSRFWNWELCRRVGMANPLTGGGFSYYSLEAYIRYYPEFMDRWPGKVWSCHSMWLTIFGEHGFPGFLLWAGLIVSCFLSLRWLRRTASNDDADGERVTQMANTLESALVAFMTAGSFLDIAYFEMFYYLIAILIALKQIVATAHSKAAPRKAPTPARHLA